MYISKKDLLKETGISYGQLYRWKREGLIPEDWFIKRSSSTGQETFFPKEQILRRVHDILQLKDQYSLEELAKVLSPEVSNRLFEEDDLIIFREIDVDLIAGFMDAYEKDNFTFLEIVLMAALSKLRKQFEMKEAEILYLAEGIFSHVASLEQDQYILRLCELANTRFLLIEKEESKLFLDAHVKILDSIHLAEISKQMKLDYQEEFHFIVKEDDENA